MPWEYEGAVMNAIDIDPISEYFMWTRVFMNDVVFFFFKGSLYDPKYNNLVF